MSNVKRVAIMYESRLGRNDGFPLYAFNLLKDKTLYPDIEVHHLIPNGDFSKMGKFDLQLVIDWGEDAVRNLLPYEPTYLKDVPTVWFASDTHLGKDFRFDFAKKADYVFFAQKLAVEEYKPTKKNKHVQWLPHGVEPRAFPSEPKALKKYDVAFVGHLVSQVRIDFLDVMFKEFPNFFFGSKISRYVKDDGQQDDIGDIFRKSKIVLNPPTKDDYNMRHTEACATGSFQLTQRVPGLEDHFQDGVHMAMYDTTEEAIEKAHYYLEHEDEREKIAETGMREVLAKHTYKHRLDTMLKVAGIIS